jgi:hypothetical protein
MFGTMTTSCQYSGLDTMGDCPHPELAYSGFGGPRLHDPIGHGPATAPAGVLVIRYTRPLGEGAAPAAAGRADERV